MAKEAFIEVEHGKLYFVKVDDENDLVATLSRARKCGFMRVYDFYKRSSWINVDRIIKVWFYEPY